jgi:drug/metabolite transporter (DMT)-like permease
MSALVGLTRKTKLVYTHRPGMQLVRSTLMFGMPAFFILALHRMSLDNVLAIFWISPLIVMAVAVLWLGETVSLPQWGAAIACFAGTLLILKPDYDVLHWSAVLPMGMALCFGLYLIMTRSMHEEDILTSLFYTAGGVFLLLSFGLPFFWEPLTLKSGLLMGSIGILVFVALYALNKSLELAPASAVAPFSYTQPIWVVGVSYLLTGHRPSVLTMVGAFIIISGLYLFNKVNL